MESETIAHCGTERKLEEEELSAAAVQYTRATISVCSILNSLDLKEPCQEFRELTFEVDRARGQENNPSHDHRSLSGRKGDCTSTQMRYVRHDTLIAVRRLLQIEL
jgi:hypothetical protein